MKVKSHDVFKITVPNEAHSKELHGVEVPLDIVYEDEHIAVINKGTMTQKRQRPRPTISDPF